MRTVGLLALIVFFPVFVHAAALININTADAALLDTLPGIGPVIAERIIKYRETNGLFAAPQDIQDVSGIGPSIYAKIESLITVGTASTPPVSDPIASSTPPNTTSTTTMPVPSFQSDASPEYIPIPTLRIVTNGDRTVSSGADVAFAAVVYDGKGNKRNDAIMAWSFGDGMRRTGGSVFHAYYDPGEYIAVVHAATSDGGDASVESVITVKDASIKITAVSSRGITLANNDSRTLDLSLWRLSMGGQEFKIPDGTKILAGRSVLFPLQVIELPIADAATLQYPSGEVAAVYPAAQLPLNTAGYQSVQVARLGEPPARQVELSAVNRVEPITSTKANAQKKYDEAVSAPAAATEFAAAGAALAPQSKTRSALASTSASSTRGIFSSPWTLGFIGTVLLAGGAFIFL